MNRLPKHELPIIPTANLVDIAILLIIFYMACSNFVSQQNAALNLPKAAGLEQLSEPLVLVTIDSQDTISLQGRTVAGAAEVESSVTELLKDKTTDEMRHVMFRCDAAVKRTVFEPVLNAIVQGGGIVVAVGDKTADAQ
ncbi:MAG: biopolymer transporter ExbD [bacterium]